ncbi:MAG: type III pantothenate kinase [Pelagibacterales bacterium]|nr:type III pantothenate kinase [Pelagibacterales bacterium]
MKYLVGDIGNTLTKISLLNKNFNILKSYNIETKKLYKKKNLEKYLDKIINLDLNKKILFSSVVPYTFQKIKSYLEKKKFKASEIKQLKIKNIIKTKVDNIKQVGSDRLANAIGAYEKYKTNCLIIDFGTATTFDIVKKPGVYDGGVIAPGINLSIYNLRKSTALLPLLSLKSNAKTYGKNTKDALNAGFLWGYQGLINNIINKITLTSKINYKVILTGGYAVFFKKYLSKETVVDENITIKGIIKIYKKFII